MADPVTPVMVTLNLAELLTYGGGGGVVSLLAGVLGYKTLAGKREVPSSACPLNGRFGAVIEMNTTMKDLAEHLKGFATQVQYEHQQQKETQDRQTRILDTCAQTLAILADRSHE